MAGQLFRQEVIAYQQERFWGECLDVQPVRMLVLTCLFLVIAVTSIAFLVSGEYSRKAVVAGVLVTDKGAVQLRAPADGVVEVVLVGQGDRVGKGEKLLVIRPGMAGIDGELLGQRLLDENARQLDNLEKRYQDALAAFPIRDRQFQEEMAGLQMQFEQLQKLITSETGISKLLERKAGRLQTLADKALVAATTLEAVLVENLQQQNLVRQLRLDLASTRQAQDRNRSDRQLLALEHRQQLAQLDKELSALHKQKLQLLSEQAITLVSPVSGTISVLNHRAGQTVMAHQPLLAVIQADSSLQAELYFPSRAIGFVEAGQQVNLRYDAFPYQKFGVQSARVEQVSGSVLQARENGSEATANEPYFKVTALPDTQHVDAFGQQVPLKAGMQFRADVVLESRSLLQWLLEPLYIRGSG